MKYNFDDINIADEVIFNSTTSQSNHDLYWKVLHKDEKTKQLIIQLDEMGYTDERWSININEVIGHIVLGKK
jgi:hypothetical protein